MKFKRSDPDSPANSSSSPPPAPNVTIGDQRYTVTVRAGEIYPTTIEMLHHQKDGTVSRYGFERDGQILKDEGFKTPTNGAALISDLMKVFKDKDWLKQHNISSGWAEQTIKDLQIGLSMQPGWRKYMPPPASSR